ncbi:universal stress protein [Sulfitobacter sp.]|uniref:universal stress protein n=1 Tax=Sulfitobacter sp. TaxID=1903071 RepID=UPI0030036909
MKNESLLVVIGKSARPVDLEPLSESAREHNLHLIVLIVGAMPPVPVYTYGVGGYGAYALPYDWQAEVDSLNSELEELRTATSQYLADQGASADVRIISGEAAALPTAIARVGLTSDTILIGDDLRKDDRLFADVMRATLFGTPAGVMLNAFRSPKALQPGSVFVAWKAGVPAARAARAALPLLRTAETVTIALFDPVATHMQDGENPGTDVAAWLTHQGCNVTVQQYPSGGEEIGTVMLKRAKESAAELIVMGAYDHSRLRETVFGGTTRTLIDQQGYPVLLCH